MIPYLLEFVFPRSEPEPSSHAQVSSAGFIMRAMVRTMLSQLDFGVLPLGGDPSLSFEAMQGRV
jgi:hypothetical protein